VRRDAVVALPSPHHHRLYLLNAGDTVFHIFGPDHIEPADLTPAARATAPMRLVYPAAIADLFD
jgi:hypothetical protein